RNCLPTQFPLRLRRSYKHLLASHAHGINGGSWFTLENPSRHDLVHHAGGEGHDVWNLDPGRWQPRNGCQLVQNLLQSQVLTAEDVAFAALALFQRQEVAPGT